MEIATSDLATTSDLTTLDLTTRGLTDTMDLISATDPTGILTDILDTVIDMMIRS